MNKGAVVTITSLQVYFARYQYGFYYLLLNAKY